MTLVVSISSGGVALPITGNPAVLQLGSSSNGQNVVAWSNWCRHQPGPVAIHARLGIAQGIPATTTSLHTPPCIAPRADSNLIVILR